MNTNLQAQCAQNISDETLSAFRDELLSPAEAQRIQAHATTCAACRDRLGGFERVGAALRGQRLARPTAHLWDEVQAAIALGEHPGTRGPLSWSPLARASRPAWRGLGALAAALLVALLFGLVLHGGLLGHGGATSRIQSTASPSFPVGTPVTVTPPAWQRYTIPGSGQIGPYHGGIAISPSDGNIAYICSYIATAGSADGGAGDARVGATYDHGAHWTWLSQVSVGSGCGLMPVDQLNASDFLVGGSDAGAFRSQDGGLTWSPLRLTTGQDTIDEFASFGGKVYAITSGYNPQINGIRSHFAVSTDGMASWQNIDLGIANGQALHFWINGTSGALLAETQSSFWQSHDGGAHWSNIEIPQNSTYYYVARADGTSAWHICGPTACTEDGGATWTPLPRLILPAELSNIQPLAPTPDGALLVVATTAIDTGLPPSETELLELPASGGPWRDLGLTPTPNPAIAIHYEPTPNGGILWEFPYISSDVPYDGSYDVAPLPPSN